MITDQQIGDLMRKIRKEKGLTTKQLANQLKISQPKLSRIETGAQPIPVTLLYQFCHIFQLSLVDFCYLLEDNDHFHDWSNIKENVPDYVEHPEYSMTKLFTSLTLDERKAIVQLIETFKNK